MSFRLAIPALTLAALLAVPAFAEDPAGKGKSPEKAAKKSAAKEDGGGGNGGGEDAETFAVVQVGRTVTVLKGSELGAYRKKVAAEYDESLKAHNEAKKKAAKAKKKFEEPKPERPTVKVVASALKSEEAAAAIRQKTVASLEKKRKKELETRSKAKQKSG